MITTGNAEVDAILVEQSAQLLILSERCATLASEKAKLKVELERFQGELKDLKADLEKPKLQAVERAS
jgi:hypothetical protein